MSETALKFGPEWLRNLSHGNSVMSPPSSPACTKYKLAEHRYGREEMLALFNKDAKMPDLSEFPFLAVEKCQLPLAYVPMTEEEQRPWSRCVNSDIVLRLTGKGGGGGNSGISRGGGRGGSVDRGRGRGRGGYYPRGLSFEDEDGPFARPRPMERSQSMSERDQRWEDRERRFDRPYTGRGSGGIDDNNSAPRKDSSRVPLDNWRRPRGQGDEGGWRTAGSRGPEKWSRGSWRNQMDKEKNGEDLDRGTHINNHDDCLPNGPNKSSSHHPNKKPLCGWDDEGDGGGDQLPEWSTEDDVDADKVGTFDASGAFMENKGHENCSEDYDSAQDDSGGEEESSNQECVKSTTKSIRPSDEKSKVETNCVQSLDKPKTEISKDHEHKEIKIVNSDQSFVDSAKDLNLINENKLSPKNERTCTIESNSVGAILTNVTKQMHPALQRPSVNCSPNHNFHEIKESNHSSSLVSVPSQPTEEDNFAHLEKATENMVAEWTAEEEQRVSSQIADKTTILPIHHDDAYKWFYRDPQGEIQGPFTPAEMLEWFTAGYFTMALMVRRGCDERFAQLGELIKTWGKVPFISSNTNPPPLRVNPMSNPISPPLTQNNVPPPALQQSNKDIMRMIQQHLLQQQIAQQMIRQQAQIQQLINQLKQEESFNNLSPQQQQMVVTQHLIAQQQLQRSTSGALGEQQNILDLLSRNQLPPPLNLSLPQMLKNDGSSLWGSPPTGFPVSWPFNANNTNQSGGGSIWDIDPHQNRMLEELENERERKKKEKEEEERRKAEEEKRRILEEQRRAEEEEKQKREEEKRRQEEEERRRQEEFKKQEEERRRQEELKKQQEEERKRREEELRRKEEERRLEELRKLEEMRKEELRKQEEERKRKELEHQRQLELELKRELEAKKELELQKERERQKELELERQKELEWQKEMQKQRQQEALRKLQEQQRSKPQAPAWGGQTPTTQLSALSLTEIQKLQEEKEKQEQNEKRLQLQLQQMQVLQQTQSNKSSLTWAQRSGNCNTPVKSLLEIQQEEAQRIAWQQKQLKQQQQQQQQQQSNLNLGNSGVWGNSTNQLLRSSSNAPWNANDIGNSVMAGFWDDAVTVNNSRKNAKSNDSAFPSLCNIVHPVNETSNKAKIIKAKKEEENVLKLFETHTKPTTDKFTQWCFDTLSNLPGLSVDVPTFVVFLKDIESPYEVHDYVKSYLGESKEAREFAKQFLERRSKFRNQSKQTPAEENMWGPAPAITPSVNKSSSQHEFDSGVSGGKGKKKKKNRMQKVDNSMLGFTVQPDPDRINVGEIDHIEGI